jgi:glycosyltransferase involved in cell wall biosynthesis
MKVLHVITGLGQGGAERQLANLLAAGTAGAVFSIIKPGVMAKEVEAVGVPLYSGHARGTLAPGWLRSLRRAIREYRPDVVMGWMYHGNLAASATRTLGHRGPIVWNVRHSVHDLGLEKAGTRWVIRAGAWLSRHPAKIIYNSITAAGQHEALGYMAKRRVVLPNGFDLERFKPDVVARDHFRAQIGVPKEEVLIGVVGRSHPMKNHVGWVAAFGQVLQRGFRARCVMMGTGVDAMDTPLDEAIRKADLEDYVIRLAPTAEPERVYPGFDLLAMPSSLGEGFPNVVGEAMACGVPAVVTPVGDAAYVVDDTGIVCSSPETDDLAAGVAAALSHGRAGLVAMGKRARCRMENRFSLDRVASRYENLLRDVARTVPKTTR